MKYFETNKIQWLVDEIVGNNQGVKEKDLLKMAIDKVRKMNDEARRKENKSENIINKIEDGIPIFLIDQIRIYIKKKLDSMSPKENKNKLSKLMEDDPPTLCKPPEGLFEEIEKKEKKGNKNTGKKVGGKNKKRKGYHSHGGKGFENSNNIQQKTLDEYRRAIFPVIDILSKDDGRVSLEELEEGGDDIKYKFFVGKNHNANRKAATAFNFFIKKCELFDGVKASPLLKENISTVEITCGNAHNVDGKELLLSIIEALEQSVERVGEISEEFDDEEYSDGEEYFDDEGKREITEEFSCFEKPPVHCKTQQYDPRFFDDVEIKSPNEPPEDIDSPDEPPPNLDNILIVKM